MLLSKCVFPVQSTRHNLRHTFRWSDECERSSEGKPVMFDAAQTQSYDTEDAQRVYVWPTALVLVQG